MPEETELKLSVRPEHAARIGKHPVIRKLHGGAPETAHLVSTYFDTPDCLLRRSGLSLRVRENKGRFTQTLKRARSSDGAILRRDEWETEIAANEPDIGAIDDADMRSFFEQSGAAGSLRPLFRTDVRRTKWDLRDDGADIELALDVGNILAENGTSAPLCEVELELKAGEPRSLYEVAMALSDRVDAVVGVFAKSERGYALCRGEAPAPVKASAVTLDEDMTVWQAFAAICRNCLAHLEANAPVAIEGKDPEGIHQARVAIRRLRAAFKVFKPALPDERRQFFAKDLRWLQKQLGDARDLDVFLAETVEPMLVRQPKEPVLRKLRDRVEAARHDAYAQARKALGSRRYGRLRLGLEQWFADASGDTVDPMLSRNVRWFAKRSIRKAQSKLLAAGENLMGLPEADLHAVRIRGKQARYCVEFFAGLFPEKPPRRHAKALAGLQDCLGALNDSVVADALLKRLERKGGALDGRAKAFVDGWFAARIHDQRAALEKLWSKIAAVGAYWD